MQALKCAENQLSQKKGHVIMIGGMSAMPLVKQMLEQEFKDLFVRICTKLTV